MEESDKYYICYNPGILSCEKQVYFTVKNALQQVSTNIAGKSVKLGDLYTVSYSGFGSSSANNDNSIQFYLSNDNKDIFIKTVSSPATNDFGSSFTLSIPQQGVSNGNYFVKATGFATTVTNSMIMSQSVTVSSLTFTVNDPNAPAAQVIPSTYFKSAVGGTITISGQDFTNGGCFNCKSSTSSKVTIQSNSISVSYSAGGSCFDAATIQLRNIQSVATVSGGMQVLGEGFYQGKLVGNVCVYLTANGLAFNSVGIACPTNLDSVTCKTTNNKVTEQFIIVKYDGSSPRSNQIPSTYFKQAVPGNVRISAIDFTKRTCTGCTGSSLSLSSVDSSSISVAYYGSTCYETAYLELKNVSSVTTLSSDSGDGIQVIGAGSYFGMNVGNVCVYLTKNGLAFNSAGTKCPSDLDSISCTNYNGFVSEQFITVKFSNSISVRETNVLTVIIVVLIVSFFLF
ncbi:hypothetical protein ABK040_006962 [Willaertia magna]